MERDASDAYLDAVLIGGREQRPIVICDYDTAWPERFAQVRARVGEALGATALRIEHIGSTAVPGLAAKPIIDVLVTVVDPDDGAAFTSALEARGYELRVQEPGHRMFRSAARDVHVHVWADSDPEVGRYLRFRDRLRSSSEDRDAYEQLKRELAKQQWREMNHYADAKGSLIQAILERGGGSRAEAAASVADCELNQAQWNCASAVAGGGSAWQDAGLIWAWRAHSGELMLNFPRSLELAAVERGIAFARDHGAHIVGAWLSSETDPATLVEAGFQRGWEPWWMAASLAAIAPADDPRVALSTDVPEYGPGGRRLLSLAEGERPSAWHAVARIDGSLAGRAWSFVAGSRAGVYDMEVWPQYQRRGLGRALLREVCDAARAAGATTVTLNATPAGEKLYSAEGFVRVGEGITYWHHLGC